ncbi:hypothetical protein A2U01_0091470, partial [Trifolium medium]|nr:hypothetical protein [Trifolium medium]
ELARLPSLSLAQARNSRIPAVSCRWSEKVSVFPSLSVTFSGPASSTGQHFLF